jgi:hypothetical protein
MPKICYKSFKFKPDTLVIIEYANSIIAEYKKEGYDLTLRQLYYQFVARNIILNNNKSYKRLGGIINDARLAGLIDWDDIVDRTRAVDGNQHWKNPQDIIEACASSYKIDTRKTQDKCMEVWVEKDALEGVVGRACKLVDVNFLSCRGYVSQSAMWRAAMRLREQEFIQNKQTVVFYLGDHDPSGLDMSRDIQNRFKVFGTETTVIRIALSMDQIQKLHLPPNPAKTTDARSQKYIEEFGNDSWELDAMDPRIIAQLITGVITKFTNKKRREELIKLQKVEGLQLQTVSDNWKEIMEKF